MKHFPLVIALVFSVVGCGSKPLEKPVAKEVGPTGMTQAVVVVLDDSGSMSWDKMNDANFALSQVISELPSNTKLGIYVLNMGWLWDLNVHTTLDAKTKQEVIDKVYQVSSSGGTPLGEAAKNAVDVLMAARKELGYGANYRLLLITDGAADNQEQFTDNITLIKQRGIGVDCIGVEMSNAHRQSILEAQVNYTDAANRDQLVEAIGQVLAEKVDDGSTGESDFDLIAPLPFQVCETSIKTLAEGVLQNQPLGEDPPQPVVEVPDGEATAHVPASAAPANKSAGRFLFIFCVACAVGIAFLVLVSKNMS